MVGMLFLVGCGGQVSDVIADKEVVSFEAQLAVSPAQPLPGKRVSLTIDITSRCSKMVNSDVALKVVDDKGNELYRQVWPNVKFQPGEVWNLTQGFTPETTLNGTDWNVVLEVRRADTGELLEAKPVGQFVLGS